MLRVVARRRSAPRRLTLGTARRLTDAQLVARLPPALQDLDRDALRALCGRFLSGQQLTESLLDADSGEWPWPRVETVWFALRVLWERWAPDLPCWETFLETLDAGYEAGDPVQACEIWLPLWPTVVAMADREGCETLEQVGELFDGPGVVFNWVQDLETALLNAGAKERRFVDERIRFCTEFLDRFPRQDALTLENLRRSLADAYAQAGERATADRLFRQWLDADPAWGWGWIGWSDTYWLFTPGEKDPAKGEEILREGLAVAHLRDRADLLDRLADLCAETGRDEEGRELERQSQELRARERRRIR
jgi:hypothetical protein